MEFLEEEILRRITLHNPEAFSTRSSKEVYIVDDSIFHLLHSPSETLWNYGTFPLI